MKTALLALLVFALALPAGRAQVYGFKLNDGQNMVEVPFSKYNNFIVVDVMFHGTLPLKFIVDTGAKNSILIYREYTDMLGFDYEREFNLYGADRRTPVKAYLVRNINLFFNGLRAERQSMLVLEENYFHFEKYLGVNIDGILGIDLFKRFIVKIDYERQLMTLYERSAFKDPKGYQALPIALRNDKIYIKSPMEVKPAMEIAADLLVDTGAGLSLILNTNSRDSALMPSHVIKGVIGQGLGGELEGYLGRVPRVELPPYAFHDVVANFHHLEDSLAVALFDDGDEPREGILGSGLLSRFDIILDVNRERIYLKPNKHYKKKFRFDRSGLTLVASGLDLSTYVVEYVLPGSPADEAGLRHGDVLLSYNGWPIGLYSLNELTRRLQGKVGKRIKLRVQRGDERESFRFELRDLFSVARGAH